MYSRVPTVCVFPKEKGTATFLRCWGLSTNCGHCWSPDTGEGVGCCFQLCRQVGRKTCARRGTHLQQGCTVVPSLCLSVAAGRRLQHGGCPACPLPHASPVCLGSYEQGLTQKGFTALQGEELGAVGVQDGAVPLHSPADGTGLCSDGGSCGVARLSIARSLAAGSRRGLQGCLHMRLALLKQAT